MDDAVPDSTVVFATTTDSDIHAFEGELDMVRMKAERNKWIETVDGRLVRAGSIVSLWVPDEDELTGYFGEGKTWE